MKTRKHLRRGAALLTILSSAVAGSASASTLVQQTALPGECIPQFAVPLPVFGPAGPIPRVNAEAHPALTVTMKEISQSVLPQGMLDVCGRGVVFGPTRVWAYETSDWFTGKVLGPANWPAVTVETQRWEPTLVTYANKLPSFNPAAPTGPGLLQGLVTVDKTIDYADPLNPSMMNSLCVNNPLGAGCSAPFTGPVPTSVHLHGGEVSSLVDGGPMAWQTPTGVKGPGYFSLWNAGPGKTVLAYPNRQEPGTLWFHDHAMGMTRTNVYSGMAAFYFLRDAYKEPANLPRGPYEIEMAVQDRQFDMNSQLFFPDGSGVAYGGDPTVTCGSGLPGDPCLNGGPGNPTVHPYWIPEFIGDTAMVNGAPWPYLNVQPRRYRFRMLDGSNARFYNLNFGAAKVYAIGSDGNYLNAPVLINRVFMAPGERYDIIVDFTGLNGQTITVTNDAPTPFPMGLSPVPYVDPACVPGPCPADQPAMASIMQFHVGPVTVSDTSCNPAVAGQCKRPAPMVALTDGTGVLPATTKIDKKRQLVLKEHPDLVTGAPLEVLVNNTFFNGMDSPNNAIDFPTNGISELPRQGSTELWEIINLTADAHPMHLHLTQFQIVSRQSFNTDPVTGYIAAWSAAFPPACIPVGGTYCPGYGPPLPYATVNADGAVGGNPAIEAGGFLLPDRAPPAPEESGWKDTAKVMPGQVLRIVVRYTPSSKPLVANASYVGQNLYPFDPTKGDGYVWHCHIIDHEDNDMMRPFRVVP
jgi:FtsP/CotA-like multicopper oxidase with cupredoxin domain